MPDTLIGIEHDHLASLIYAARKRLLERGVICITDAIKDGKKVYIFQGMSNKYVSVLTPPEVAEQPSPEQADQMVADMVLSVEQGLLQRRTEIEE